MVLVKKKKDDKTYNDKNRKASRLKDQRTGSICNENLAIKWELKCTTSASCVLLGGGTQLK